MKREPAEPLRLNYLIKAGTIHSMTGETYRCVGLRGPEIVAVSAEPDGLDDLVAADTAVVDAGRPARSIRDNLAVALVSAGALLLPVAMFLPWYRNVGANGGTHPAWGGYWFVIAEMVLLFLAGARLALGVLAGRPLRPPAVTVVIGFAFVVTITVVIALFVARPGGNAATAVAFGGYVGLAAIGTIKGGAIVMATNTRNRMTSGVIPGQEGPTRRQAS